MPAVGDTTANPTESQKTQYYYNEEVLRRLAEAREANQHLMGENKRLQDELQRASSLGTSKEAKDTIQRLIRAQEANMQKMQRLRKLYKRTSRQQQQQQHEADPDQLAAEDYDETAYRDHVAEEDAILDDDEPANLFADEEEIMRQEEEDNRRQDEEDAIRDAEDAMREQEYDMDDELLGLDRRSIGSDWTEHGDPRASVQKTKSGGIMSPPRVSGPSTFAEETETRPPNQKRRYLQGDEKRPRKPKWSQLQELYKKDGRDDDMRRVSELVRKQDALAQELEVLMQEDEMKRKQQQQQVEQAQIAELESHEAAADRAREATERWAREEEEEEKARKEEEFRQDAEEELRQEREREQQLRRLEEEEATIYDDDTDDSVGFDGEDEEEDEYLREARGEE
ncbi:hypothetical protein B0T24DRAFT_358679 [Lasiosphaeria ovina]|uniref:Uncharacterized protein n=1 Tax=Lasiosphaeria ovina TaxID=92902 RepID=A0AAE0N3W8_9PEZI|nr:hypothetical protein B0T24DRAFT_358679 [Lasiosphaeria ovina]